MQHRIALKYVYADVKQDVGFSSSSPFNIHQVDEDLISKVISSEATTLTRTDLFKLLKEDGAYFYHDTVRLYNKQTQTFIRLPKNYVYDLRQMTPTSKAEPHQPHNELLLWIQGIDKPFKNRIKSLNHRVLRLEKQQKEYSKRMEMGSPVGPLPQTLPTRTSDPEIFFNIPYSRRSSILPGFVL